MKVFIKAVNLTLEDATVTYRSYTNIDGTERIARVTEGYEVVPYDITSALSKNLLGCLGNPGKVIGYKRVHRTVTEYC